MATWGELEKAGTKWRDLEEMTWGELEEFCVINPKTKQIPDDMEVSFVPMQSVSDTGAVQTDEVRKASEVKKGFTFFEEGDVLFAKITPCMENGKGGIARGLKNGVGFGSTEFHVLHPAPEKVSSEWLYYLTSWDEFRKQCARNMTGSAGQKRVPKSYLEHYKVYLPPLDEQRRIAAVLDKVSDLIAKRREQLDKLDELVKARFAEMFGDPVSNPYNWEKVPLSELADIRIGPFGSLLHKEDYIEGGHPLVNPSHIIDGKIVIDEKLTVSHQKYIELEAYHLKAGDVVMGRRGEMGRCAVVSQEGLLCGTGSLLIRPKGKVTADYIQKIISFPSFKKTIEDMAVGQTMPNLNVPIVSAFQIIKPPMQVQENYYTLVTQVDKSKLTIQQSLDKLEVLKKALMQQYFG